MDVLSKDAANMLDVTEKTVNSKDPLTQCVYWMAVAIYHIIIHIKRKGDKERHKAEGRE